MHFYVEIVFKKIFLPLSWHILQTASTFCSWRQTPHVGFVQNVQMVFLELMEKQALNYFPDSISLQKNQTKKAHHLQVDKMNDVSKMTRLINQKI
ncbi:hypothetical protein BpHYR1_017561 [Brachionus plicatilis]|uniref:Uncharacterized protein n=1 Tax=Brachionus plicatilis TaxID=10195 RepID=A0A3M7QSD6_BRAPC|nr:hypothetical protein BpHYR1_017561 [Brachionus plicatilis]